MTLPDVENCTHKFITVRKIFTRQFCGECGWYSEYIEIAKKDEQIKLLREALEDVASMRDRDCHKSQCTCVFDHAQITLKKLGEMK